MQLLDFFKFENYDYIPERILRIFWEAQLWTPKNHPGLFLLFITTWHLANAMLSWIRLCKRPLLSTTAPYLQTDLQKILSVMAQIPILK
jgi:hypothetical protein